MKKVLYLAFALVILMSNMVVFGLKNDFESSWAKNEINYLKDRSIISAYPDGNFRPDDNMKKSEFYKVVNSLMGFTQKSEINFNDVVPEDWYYDEVKKGVGANYILSGTTLNAEENITRGEVARIIGIIFEIEEDRSEAAKFEDCLTLPEELKGVIGGLKKNGYINGYPDGTFKPNAAITRAEVVKMIYDISGEIVNEAGNINKNIDKNLIVNTADVTLKDMTIEGDLYLTEGIGEGNVVLDNVIVKGNVMVNGGGPNSVKFTNSQLGSVFVNKKQGLVNMVFSNSKVEEIKTVNKVRLELTQGGYIKKLELKDEANVISAKDTSIDSLSISGGNIVVDSKGTIKYIKSGNQFKVNGSLLKANVEYKLVDGKLEELSKSVVSSGGNFISATLKSISVKSLPDKLDYELGDTLDISGLVVEGLYTDGNRKTEKITLSNITGFNSKYAVKKQVLTITVGGKTTSFNINILEPKTNKSELSFAMFKARLKIKNDYTEESWSKFEKALENAVKIDEDVKATQEEVNQAASELNAAMNELKGKDEPVEPEVDKKDLSKAIEEAQKKNETDYTAESWTSFAEALATAKVVNGNETATQEEVNHALSELNAAMSGLKVKEEPTEPEVDKKALSKAIEEALKKNEAVYTAESWITFAEALEKANKINKAEAATQEEVNQALSELNAAMDGLREKEEPSDPDITNIMPNEDVKLEVGDILEVSFNAAEGGSAYFRLLIPSTENENEIDNESSNNYKIAMIEINPGFYSTTWTAIKGISAKKLKVEMNFESKEGDKSCSIAKGRVSIILDDPEVDKTALSEAIEEAMKKNVENYTEESWTIFAEALETAKEVNKAEAATKEEVNQALSGLNAAMNALIEKEKTKPEIIATFHKSFFTNFGNVAVQVQNIAGAAKFDVVYNLSDNTDGSENIKETKIVGLNEQTELMFYDEAQHNTVTIRIYDENGVKLHEFTDVVLVRK